MIKYIETFNGLLVHVGYSYVMDKEYDERCIVGLVEICDEHFGKVKRPDGEIWYTLLTRLDMEV